MTSWARLRTLVRRTLPLCAASCTGGEPLTVGDALAPLWFEEFDGADGRMQDHRSAWIHVFGQLTLQSATGAALSDPGSEDWDDDYAYRPQPGTDLIIAADVYWDPADGVGVELICPPGRVHESLYELALYQDRLQLLRYDGGGDPRVYEVLDTTKPLGLSSGRYSLVMRARHDGERWRLRGELRSPDSPTAVATLGVTRDSTHGPSIGQGVGIYNVSEQASRVYSIRVEGT